MKRPFRFALSATLPAALAATLAAPVEGQTPLPMGTTESGMVSGTGSAEYAVQVSGPGFLTVVARSDAGEDIRLVITDDEGQVLPDGQVDVDLGGNVGAEQAVLVIPRAGRYLVKVETFGQSSARFSVGGSFLGSTLVAGVDDPDGKPSGARVLAVGADHNDEIDPGAGDTYDWFRIEAAQAGVLTVLTRSDEGDLALELYAEGAYSEAVERSDQDQGGSLGNESVTADVVQGQVVYVRVGPSFMGSASRIAYRIASGIIPG